MLKTFAAIFLSFVAVAVHAQSSLYDSLQFKKQILFQQSAALINLHTTVIPQGFYTKNLPFFCDKEYKLEKLTKIPFRFRLGSVEYCDKMEGKNK